MVESLFRSQTQTLPGDKMLRSGPCRQLIRNTMIFGLARDHKIPGVKGTGRPLMSLGEPPPPKKKK